MMSLFHFLLQNCAKTLCLHIRHSCQKTLGTPRQIYWKWLVKWVLKSSWYRNSRGLDPSRSSRWPGPLKSAPVTPHTEAYPEWKSWKLAAMKIHGPCHSDRMWSYHISLNQPILGKGFLVNLPDVIDHQGSMDPFSKTWFPYVINTWNQRLQYDHLNDTKQSGALFVYWSSVMFKVGNR